MKKDTLLTHLGRDPSKSSGTVNTPVFRASTIVFPDLEAYEKRPGDNYKTPRYGIHGTPTTWALEEAIAKVEGGYEAVALPSGLAAITAALCAFAKTGSHVLLADTVYGPTRHFCDKRLTAFGVEIQYYDPFIGSEIKNLIKSNTCAIYCEAPGSLTFEMQDIPAIAHEARARNIPVLADTTWGTPYFFRSFEHGVDVSIHAGTKYIVGHSDVMLGVVVANEKYWLPVRKTVAEFGFCVSPDDCYLALRGFRTIGVRMKQQMASALKIARWLEARPEVDCVLYPALESHPGHAIWKRDFEGAASLFSFVLDGASKKQVSAFINALKHFGIGSSWGGYESLAISPPIASVRTATQWKAAGPVIRLHIGLDDPDDLIEDLEQAFARMAQAA
jgi:cystathionine beta-lyase